MTTITEHRPSAAPERSLQQRRAALRLANETRSRRAQLKRDLKAGRARLVDLLADPPEYLETMKVGDLLISTPKWGQVKARKALRACEISPSRTVGGVSPRQRKWLVAWIRGH